jgi:F-type H+-transporting ATPase subunit b
MSLDATFWATIALLIFIAILVWLRVPGQIGASLDKRSQKIRDDLDEARRLREEAQELLAEYQRKRKEAETEAEEIVAAAKREAELLAEEAAKKTSEFVERRTAMAEQKIAQAESQAVADVKASAVNLAVAAAESIIQEKVTGKTATDLISKGIDEVKAKLN